MFTEILSIGIAFLIGSIPFGLLIAKHYGFGDIREIGSGNIGATNVLRTGRKDLAAATLFLDALKGAIPVWLAWSVFDASLAFAALAAVAGHCYSPWLGFKGGKGVATTLGALFVFSFLTFIIACLLWVSIFLLTRISSLAALVAIGIAPFVVWMLGGMVDGTVMLLIAALVWYRHQANIQRLARGVEPKSEFGRNLLLRVLVVITSCILTKLILLL